MSRVVSRPSSPWVAVPLDHSAGQPRLWGSEACFGVPKRSETDPDETDSDIQGNRPGETDPETDPDIQSLVKGAFWVSEFVLGVLGVSWVSFGCLSLSSF
jgi:hypothetical protein